MLEIALLNVLSSLKRFSFFYSHFFHLNFKYKCIISEEMFRGKNCVRIESKNKFNPIKNVRKKDKIDLKEYHPIRSLLPLFTSKSFKFFLRSYLYLCACMNEICESTLLRLDKFDGLTPPPKFDQADFDENLNRKLARGDVLSACCVLKSLNQLLVHKQVYSLLL